MIREVDRRPHFYAGRPGTPEPAFFADFHFEQAEHVKETLERHRRSHVAVMQRHKLEESPQVFIMIADRSLAFRCELLLVG